LVQLQADAASFKPLTVDAPSYVPGQKVRLSGTATPNGAINILGNSAGISENLTADADGKWSFESRYAVAGLQHQVRVRQTAANDAGILVQLQASDENGEKPVFRPLAVTSDTSYVPGGTTRLTGTATSWSQVRVALSNPGGKPVPGANVWTHTVMAGADGAWSVEIPNHRLISAKVQQYGELGNGTVSFDFTR
ncbi:hypothetical protein, partial [Curtobacterium sp. MCBA15_016]|uniref:hypothetical protein n=1 Tax=Curtobacterium sp. MCBA15_016 TaxID=1898740 RepID=UPI0015874AE6